MTYYWAHYGAIVEEFGAWQGITVGPVEQGVPTPENIGAAPLLGVWDHEPTVAEIDAVTPWDYRTICPVCATKWCDDTAHSEANSTKIIQEASP